MVDVYRRRIPEHPGAGRCGRHVHHDPRSKSYPYRASAGAALTSVRHIRHMAVLDQNQVGSCTGNACLGALGTSGLYDQLINAYKLPPLNEAYARDVLYHLATTFDSEPGTYPPQDTGSDGLSVAKAAQSLGLISGYRHAFSFDDALAALVEQPVIIGVDWYAGFDSPTADGEMKLAGAVRGGHELVLDEIDVERQRVWITNSWGNWALAGRAWWSWDTLQKLLAADGDVTVLVGVGGPAPTPTPAIDPDKVLVVATSEWTTLRHVGANRAAAQAVVTWRQAKGL